MATEFLADTNIIIRYLTRRPAEQASIVHELMEKVKAGKVILHVRPMVVAECCYVLEGNTGHNGLI